MDEAVIKVELRVWNPSRSKLAIAIISGVDDIWIIEDVTKVELRVWNPSRPKFDDIWIGEVVLKVELRLWNPSHSKLAIAIIRGVDDIWILDSITYKTLLSVCISNNRCEEVEKYFEQSKSEAHDPIVFHYSSLLNAYAIDGNYEKADKLIQEMKSAGLELNKVCKNDLQNSTTHALHG
ncbi:pentatricopeptide repeat-containing At1g10910, chloroplastic isoform X1 [Olea europaea subsp. europaea]|uniref:Pentatricopeptide repeat-containing At1g10910, chloroplastic isoform X1 n=1 Tax=Olea europaea subsp. europaea TaxID=158383 RepID=A0A8S0QCU5_OLEEU|nr:pentatricopeptide repeat-containing At1g10910, chloroplastic isoform X1 [Olea europaea subsp. europaea]